MSNDFLQYPLSDPSWRKKYTIRGANRSLLTTYNDFWDDFQEGATRRSSAAANGTIASITTVPGGAITITSGALANGNCYLLTAVEGGWSSNQLSNPKTENWYMAAFGKVTTTPDAQATLGWTLSAANNTLWMGVNGAKSTTKYVLTINTGASDYIASTVTIDTGWHVFEAWHTSGTAYFAVDDEPPVTIADTNMTTSAAQISMGFANNGTTAAAQTIVVGKCLMLMPKEA